MKMSVVRVLERSRLFKFFKHFVFFSFVEYSSSFLFPRCQSKKCGCEFRANCDREQGDTISPPVFKIFYFLVRIWYFCLFGL